MLQNMDLHREEGALLSSHTKIPPHTHTILTSQLLDQTVFLIMLDFLHIHLKLLVYLLTTSEAHS